MPNYRRPAVAGGTYFLTLVTLVTLGRTPIFADAAARRGLRRAMATTRAAHPFDLIAIVLLPDHVHLVLALPVGDANVSVRVAGIKAGFTREWLAGGGREAKQSAGRERQGYRGVWQRRFWDHLIRDEAALAACCDYVHYNPVKHGHARCPHAWPYSSFHRQVRANHYAADWLCVCAGDGHGIKSPREVPGPEMD